MAEYLQFGVVTLDSHRKLRFQYVNNAKSAKSFASWVKMMTRDT